MTRFALHFVPVPVLLLASAGAQMDALFADLHRSRDRTLSTLHYGWPQPMLEVRRENYRRTLIYPSGKIPPNSTTTRWKWRGALTNVFAIVFVVGICWRSWAVRDQERFLSRQWNVGTQFRIVTVTAITITLLQSGFPFPFATDAVPLPEWIHTGYESAIMQLIGFYCIVVILWRALAVVPGLGRQAGRQRQVIREFE